MKVKIRFLQMLLPLLMAAMLSGCASYEKKVGRENWVAVMANSALTSGKLSYLSRQFLVQNAIIDEYSANPRKLIGQLAEYVENPEKNNLVIISDFGDVRPALNVLIELCMLEALNADEDEAITYWTSCSFYSYKLLFDRTLHPKDLDFDYLSEVAALRYYNISTSEIFSYLFMNKIPFGKEVELPAVLGKVKLGGLKSNLFWPPDSFQNFVVSYDYIPTALNSHSFTSGLGVPLVAIHDRDFHPKESKELLVLNISYPMTFLVRYDKFKFDGSEIVASSEFYDDFKSKEVEIADIKVPLAMDFSIVLTNLLSFRPYIESGIFGMINSDRMDDIEGLYMISPYDENKIPVVLVHGLMSAPRTWLQVINTLLCSPELRERYQFWLFAYPTGQPVYFSASKLRNDLLDIRKKYDPQGKNPNLDNMVVIGHSMGGLLTRLMIQDSEDKKLINTLLEMNSINKKYDEIDLPPELKEFFEENLIFKPLPFVKRVVFVAAPHRGSDTATWEISKFGSSLINLPSKMAGKTRTAFQKLSYYASSDARKIRIATSIDNLTPGSMFVRSYNGLPMDKDVKMHSIMGNEDEAGVKGGSDGVVPYSSSHLDGVLSEAIYKSGHNVQTTPECSKEIRRILMEHLKESK